MSGDEEVGEQHRPRRGRVNGGTEFASDGRLNVLVLTRGHPFVRDPFYAAFESMASIEWSSVEHPAAQLLIDPGSAAHFDCYVFYDMPGIEFRAGGVPRFFDPPDGWIDSLQRTLEVGTPMVILHHACAAWPSWPGWAEIVGAHFLYQPGESRGVAMPDSGYVLDVEHTVTPVPGHPITDGLEPFTLNDELYLCPVFEDDVTPLFTSDFEFVDTNFSSAALALKGRLNERGDWTHPPGSNVVGWVKRAGNSPIVYLQFGDGPATHGDPNYRAVLERSIAWASSPEAAAWARDHG